MEMNHGARMEALPDCAKSSLGFSKTGLYPVEFLMEGSATADDRWTGGTPRWSNGQGLFSIYIAAVGLSRVLFHPRRPPPSAVLLPASSTSDARLCPSHHVLSPAAAGRMKNVVIDLAATDPEMVPSSASVAGVDAQLCVLSDTNACTADALTLPLVSEELRRIILQGFRAYTSRQP